MTYAFIETYMRNVQDEYLTLTNSNTENKINKILGIDNATVEIFQRVEECQINRLIVKTHRHHNYRQVNSYLTMRLNIDVADKIINEYLSSYDRIYIQVDIYQDPFLDKPEWKLRILQVRGLYVSEYIIQMVNEMSRRSGMGLHGDLILFMKKISKLLKYV
jgi:hypothetical protein